MPKPVYTLVQHTGYVVSQHAEFARAVESKTVRGAALVEAIVRAGGVVFTDYAAAESRAEAENYPPEVQGLVPRAAGTFSDTLSVEGCPVYLPAKPSKDLDTELPDLLRRAADALEREEVMYAMGLDFEHLGAITQQVEVTKVDPRGTQYVEIESRPLTEAQMQADIDEHEAFVRALRDAADRRQAP